MPTKYDEALSGGCILPACNPSAPGATAALERSSEMMKSDGGGEGGDAYKSDKSLLSLDGSELYRHLYHIYSKRTEAVEGLITVLYDKVGGGVSRTDLERIFIYLGGNYGGGGV